MTSQNASVFSDLYTTSQNASVFSDLYTTSHNASVFSDSHTDVEIKSVPEGCAGVRFSEWEYLPWNNSDNIVSQEAQLITAQVRTNVLQILFFIGAPANVINMAVFFKQGLKDRVNLVLFSLSLADELYLLTYVLHFFEEFYLQFSGERELGPFFTLLMNNRVSGLFGCCFISMVLSAIIACERCCCVLWPLKYQTLIRTRTLAVVIVAVFVIVLGFHFLVISKYHISCVYDYDTGVAFSGFMQSDFYRRHTVLIDNIDNAFFGAGLPTVTMVVVTTATIITIIKLRQVVTWRTEITTSSVSAKEVALTKMLVGTSVLFIVCVFPSCLFRVASMFLPELNSGRRYDNLYFTFLWVTQMFVHINSIFNIFIYYTMGTRYRETFWDLLKRKEGEKRKA